MLKVPSWLDASYHSFASHVQFRDGIGEMDQTFVVSEHTLFVRCINRNKVDQTQICRRSH